MELYFSDEWECRQLSDASAAIFNPYTGDLHALPELSARLVAGLSDPGVPFESLLDKLAADFPDDDRQALEREARSSIASLIELGVISARTDSGKYDSGSASPPAAD